MLVPPQKEFIKVLRGIDHSRSLRDKFGDFAELAYTALAQRGPACSASDLEERYLRCVKRYDKLEDRMAFPKLLAMVVSAANEWYDFFGPIAGDDDIHALNPEMGQILTPWPICQMMAGMTITSDMPDKGYIIVGEPACGTGAMILAAAEVWEGYGHDLKDTFMVEATDLSELMYKLAFIQLSVNGIPAKVIHGNTLSGEVFESAWTPVSHVFFKYQRSGRLPNNRPARIDTRRRPRRRIYADPR